MNLRPVHLGFLVLNLLFLWMNLALDGPLVWVSIIGILASLVGLYFDAKTRRSRQIIKRVEDAERAMWAQIMKDHRADQLRGKP